MKPSAQRGHSPFTIALPVRVGQPKGNSWHSDGRFGCFETITGAYLWELSEIETPQVGGHPLDKKGDFQL